MNETELPEGDDVVDSQDRAEGGSGPLLSRRGALGVLVAGAVVVACTDTPQEQVSTQSLEPARPGPVTAGDKPPVKTVVVKLDAATIEADEAMAQVALPNDDLVSGLMGGDPSPAGGESGVPGQQGSGESAESYFSGGADKPNAEPPAANEDDTPGGNTAGTDMPGDSGDSGGSATSNAERPVLDLGDTPSAGMPSDGQAPGAMSEAMPNDAMTSTTSTTVTPPSTAVPAATAAAPAAPAATTATTAVPAAAAVSGTTATTAPESTPAPVVPTTGSAELTAETAVAKLTFGPTPGLIARVRAMGPQAFIEDQLRRTGPDGRVEADVKAILPIHMSPQEHRHNRIRSWWMPNYTGHSGLYRASRSENQLYEMMGQMWMDHLNVFLTDMGAFFIPHYQEKVIRPHAMGKFKDMLKASAHSPAMLTYLDNNVSDASRQDGINENYGRELLELHTLGIDGNNGKVYSEQDVQNVAFVMGGWTTEDNFYRDLDSFGEFIYRKDFAYQGPELTILNGAWTTAGKSGKARGDSLLEFLATHPSTARNVARRICRRFVSDNPSDGLINSAAEVFFQNDTAIVPVLRHVFQSDEFAASGGQKVRRPIEYQAALARATNTTFSNVGEHADFRALDGYFLSPARHSPWSWQQPDGYPDDGEYWTSADSFPGRWQHAIYMAEGRRWTVNIDVLYRAAGGSTAGEILQNLAAELGIGPLPETEIETFLAVRKLTPDMAAGDFDIKLFGTLVGLLLSHPRFQTR